MKKGNLNAFFREKCLTKNTNINGIVFLPQENALETMKKSL